MRFSPQDSKLSIEENRMNSFYSTDELKTIGLKYIGSDVRISRKVCIYGANQIAIGNHVRIDDFAILSGRIEIGDFVHIAAFCALFGARGIHMADFSGLSARVIVYSATDDYSGDCLTNPTIPTPYRQTSGGLVSFGRHVIVGAGCVILPNIEIGEGAAIGAMSLVRKNILPWTRLSIWACPPDKSEFGIRACYT